MTMEPLYCSSYSAGVPREKPLAPIVSSQPLKCEREKGQSLRKSRYIPRSFVQHNYHDRSNELPDCAPTVTRGGISTLFPQKLHGVLDRIAADGLGHVCSWQPHGRAFVVHDPKEFKAIMPRYFGKMQMASFQRQLNLYGFMRLTHGPDKGGYYHELFLQHRFYLCKKIHRIRVKGNGSRSAQNPDAEPNFYAMPPVAPVLMPQMAVPPQAAAPMPAKPVPAQPSVAPIRSVGPRQVSLTERDLVRSFESASLESPQPEAEHESDEQLDENTFWASMECLMETMDESESGLSVDDLDELDKIIEPSPVAQASDRSISPRPTEVLSSESAILDDEVTEFLKEMFEKEQPLSPAKPAVTKAPQIKGISMSGGANAVAYVRHGAAFRRRRSAVNAAA